MPQSASVGADLRDVGEFRDVQVYLRTLVLVSQRQRVVVSLCLLSFGTSSLLLQRTPSVLCTDLRFSPLDKSLNLPLARSLQDFYGCLHETNLTNSHHSKVRARLRV